MATPRRTPIQQRSRERVELVLDAAEALIAEHGVPEFTTTAVAERTGIPVGSIYQYFADREAILAELVDRHLESMNARVVTDISNARRLDVKTLVETAMQSHVAFYRANPAFVKMWFHGRLSTAIVAKQRKRNVELAKWLRAVADQFGLIREDAPELGGWFTVEIGDRILEMAFRRDPNGDDEIIEQGTEMLALYLDRFATETGRTGREIITLPTLPTGS